MPLLFEYRPSLALWGVNPDVLPHPEYTVACNRQPWKVNYSSAAASFPEESARLAGFDSWKSRSGSTIEFLNSFDARQFRQTPRLMGPLAGSIIQWWQHDGMVCCSGISCMVSCRSTISIPPCVTEFTGWTQGSQWILGNWLLNNLLSYSLTAGCTQGLVADSYVQGRNSKRSYAITRAQIAQPKLIYPAGIMSTIPQHKFGGFLKF